GPQDATAVWYAWRSWIEQGFRDLKSDGWQLAKTRMTDPERVGRWWTAAALATLWALEAGAEAQRLEIPATQTYAKAGGAAGARPVRAGVGGVGPAAGARVGAAFAAPAATRVARQGRRQPSASRTK